MEKGKGANIKEYQGGKTVGIGKIRLNRALRRTRKGGKAQRRELARGLPPTIWSQKCRKGRG